MTRSTISPRARTLPVQGAANQVMRALLGTPLLGRLLGRRLIIMYVVGRKSGRQFRVPVTYATQGDTLLVGTEFGWGRNLRTGEPIEIRLQGKRRTAAVEVFSDEAGVIEGYAVISRDNHQFARFNKIRIDQAGEPDAGDLHLAWAAGARVFRLRPQ